MFLPKCFPVKFSCDPPQATWALTITHHYARPANCHPALHSSDQIHTDQRRLWYTPGPWLWNINVGGEQRQELQERVITFRFPLFCPAPSPWSCLRRFCLPGVQVHRFPAPTIFPAPAIAISQWELWDNSCCLTRGYSLTSSCELRTQQNCLGSLCLLHSKIPGTQGQQCPAFAGRLAAHHSQSSVSAMLLTGVLLGVPGDGLHLSTKPFNRLF